MKDTKIEWATHSWSPWRGCTKVSPGCAHCYAEALSRRNPALLGEWGKGAPRVLAKNWTSPIGWDRGFSKADYFTRLQGQERPARPRVFPSLCDWLDPEAPVLWLGRFLHLIASTPNLDWLLLTKRPELFVRRMSDVADESAPWAVYGRRWMAGNAPSNVWFGVSVEDQPRADERIPILLSIPAAIRWLSVEPLLGPVRLAYPTFNGTDSFGSLEGLHWVVVGGESGPGARDCDVAWISSIIWECRANAVPVFVKQLGSRPIMEPGPISLETEHPKGGDPSEWPSSLHVRQYPKKGRASSSATAQTASRGFPR